MINDQFGEVSLASYYFFIARCSKKAGNSIFGLFIVYRRYRILQQFQEAVMPEAFRDVSINSPIASNGEG